MYPIYEMSPSISNSKSIHKLGLSLRTWSRRTGIEMAEGKYLYHLLFADDQVIIIQDEEDANYTCDALSANGDGN